MKQLKISKRPIGFEPVGLFLFSLFENFLKSQSAAFRIRASNEAKSRINRALSGINATFYEIDAAQSAINLAKSLVDVTLSDINPAKSEVEVTKSEIDLVIYDINCQKSGIDDVNYEVNLVKSLIHPAFCEALPEKQM